MAAESVFEEIRKVLKKIEKDVGSDEFKGALVIVKEMPGIKDVWATITDGLKVVFTALEEALNAIKDKAEGIGPVVDFSTNMTTLLDQISGLITGDASKTLDTIKSSVGTVSGISAEAEDLIDEIIVLVGSIKGALEI